MEISDLVSQYAGLDYITEPAFSGLWTTGAQVVEVSSLRLQTTQEPVKHEAELTAKSY